MNQKGQLKPNTVCELEPLVFESSKSGKEGVFLPKRKFPDRDFSHFVSQGLQRQTIPGLPELSEPEIVRHFTSLSRKNFSVDTHFYPLGSCTMKYNPKINEDIASLDGFSALHPLQEPKQIQGMLRLFYELSHSLCELTGMDDLTLQPAAGAHGELLGMMLVRAWHQSRGEAKRSKVIVPDSSHGTNPASAALFGYQVVQVPSNSKGRVDLKALEAVLDDEVACLMLTNPNTLGLFESDILKIRDLVHAKGALLYYDGANLNALLANLRPGDMGFDIVHLNLHKTFSTPHGGGGPGAGAVGVKKFLSPFLPLPQVVKKGNEYQFDYGRPQSVGKIKSFYGNVGVFVRAYAYIRILGLEGLRQVSHDSVLAANYLRKKLSQAYRSSHDEACMHEFVLSAADFAAQNVHAGDIGKRLLDYGIHAPTVHFPLVVKEALMIEPTETESKATLDHFIEVMLQIRKEIAESPEVVIHAPHTMVIKRPDEVAAARKPILSYRDYASDQNDSAISNTP